ncbi:MAG: hypothetical protein H6510_01015 [Acidobacteria bacterium]|nr:hypothetical protein [Acidobacteriota bacterium]MCB9396369.1 hypothetical protein [Acidobacteriota bacterium]
MNKPCLKCGNILLVPDIPLPKTYTQRCIACGFDNPVGDDLFFEPESRDELDVLNFDEIDENVESHLTRGISRENADNFLEQLKRQPEPPPAPIVHSPVHTPTPSTSQYSFTPGINQRDLDQLQKQLRSEFEAKIKELEAKVMAQLAVQAQHPIQHSPIEPEKPRSEFQKVVREMVSVNEALICTQNSALIKACEVALRQKGFSLTAASSVEEAKARIQEYAYQVIIFDYRFVQGSPEGQSLLGSIRLIALPIRRHQAIVLITPGLPTCESQVFYQLGVDLNINPDDLGSLGELVRQLVDLKSELLRPYLESNLDTDRLMV